MTKTCLIAVLTFLICAQIRVDAVEDSVKPNVLSTLLDFVPPDTRLKRGGRWDPVGAELTTQAMKPAIGKPMEFVFRVEVVEPHQANGHAILVRSKPASLRIADGTMPLFVWAYFPTESVPDLREVTRGSIITATGILEKAEVELRGKDASLVCNIIGCRAKPASLISLPQ